MRTRKVGFAFLFLLVAGVTQAFAQTRVVTGRVTDAVTNAPVVSAQVMVSGTTISTVTAADGAFTIGVPTGTVALVIRRIGYKRFDVTVAANTSTVQVVLDADVLRLDEVIMTGRTVRSSVQVLAEDLMTGARAGMSVRSGYISSLGILGRESYNFDPSDPQFMTGLLRGPLDGSNRAFGGAHWVPRYANIRNANITQEALDDAGGSFTTEEAEAIRGFAKTIQAHDFLLTINTRDDFGAPIDVGGDPTAGPPPIVTKDAVFTRIVQLLDEADGHLSSGGTAFPFELSTGFNGFDTPATFKMFNRGLRARVNAYQQDWAGVLTSLGGSFLNDGPGLGVSGLNVGVYHTFSSAPGDAVNGIFDPSRLIIVAHPSIVTDAQAGDARLARKVVQIPSVDDQAGEGVSTDRAFDIYDGLSAPIAYIRNEELILLRADANLGLGTPAGIDAALPDINVIRQESGGLAPIALDTWQAMTDTERTDELLYNRRYSLLFEGHRWIDMRRYGRLTALPIDAGTTFVRFSRFPFPVRECNTRVPPPSQGCALELGF